MIALLDDEQLEHSWVVANSQMNRERGCTGGNSYAQELGFNPLTWLQERLASQARVAWLDLCCGTGRALIEAAQHFSAIDATSRVTLTGLDLVDMFARPSAPLPNLQFIAASWRDWPPPTRYDLITCVHGWHYVGDKLSLWQKSVSWLAVNGLLIGHLDLANLRGSNGAVIGRRIVRDLRDRNFTYDARRRLLARTGATHNLNLPYRYLGADDHAGANYTGQAAVNSYYKAKQ